MLRARHGFEAALRASSYPPSILTRKNCHSPYTGGQRLQWRPNWAGSGSWLIHLGNPGFTCLRAVGMAVSMRQEFLDVHKQSNLVNSEQLLAAGELPSLLPRSGNGFQFVAYGDCCIGPPEPGRGHEEHLAAIHRGIHRLEPKPEFVCFLGNLIWGLTKEHGPNDDGDSLSDEWATKLSGEMKPLTDLGVPVFRIPGNHDTMTPISETVWRKVFPEISKNGPEGQEGLSWYERHEDILIIGISVYATAMGSPFTMMGGRVDYAWVDRVLSEHADAKYRLVLGHSPVHLVNGYNAPKWTMLPEFGEPFWNVLAKHGVTAYLCSHVIAFDFQVHQGVPQITAGGAGTNSGPGGCMPAPAEYHHSVQMAVDEFGLRGQALDMDGTARETFEWPLRRDGILEWSFTGGPLSPQAARVLAAGSSPREAYPRVRISLDGYQPRINVLLYDPADIYPVCWSGPEIDISQRFDFTVAIDPNLGPGGVLARAGGGPFSSLVTDAPTGYKANGRPDTWEFSDEVQVSQQ